MCQNSKSIVQVLLSPSLLCRHPFASPHLTVRSSFSLAVSLRGEFVPRGRKFRCCLSFLWRSSGEMRRPSSQPAGACEPLVSAFLLRPMKRWTKSLRSSQSWESVAPYQVSLTPGRSSPHSAVSGVDECDRRGGGREKTEQWINPSWVPIHIFSLCELYLCIISAVNANGMHLGQLVYFCVNFSIKWN